jgi:hypothetical protein
VTEHTRETVITYKGNSYLRFGGRGRMLKIAERIDADEKAKHWIQRYPFVEIGEADWAKLLLLVLDEPDAVTYYPHIGNDAHRFHYVAQTHTIADLVLQTRIPV